MGLPTQALQGLAITTPLVAGFQQSRAAEALAAAQSAAAQRNAQLVRLEGGLESRRRREIGRRELSKLRANIAGRGIEVSGSPLDGLALAAADIERDALNAQLSARNTARLELAQAGAARRAGRIRGRTSLLLGATQAASVGASFLPRSR